MQLAGEILQHLQAALFALIGLVAFVQWVRNRGRAQGWLAATFGSLALIVVAGEFLPDNPSPEPAWFDAANKALISILSLFPYAIFRFTETFEPARRGWRVAAATMTAIVAPSVWFVGNLPERSDPRGRAFIAWIALFLVNWLVLSIFAAGRLWRAGRRQPRIARRRMTTMAAGLTVLAGLILVAATAPPQQEEIQASDLVRRSVGLLASPLFLLGFAPPRVIVWLWRRRDEEELHAAEASLINAKSPQEIGAVLLPHALSLVAGSAAILRSPDGVVLASHGDAFEVSALSLIGEGDERPGVVHIAGERSSMVVKLGPYAPYFGEEELRILSSLASLADLALARSALLDEQAGMVATLRAANETLRDFVAIASHDLRTPLTVIQGLIEMLDEHWDRFDESKKREQIAAVRRQGRHLSRLVEDLLTVSRIDAGVVEPQIATVEVDAALRSVVRDFAGELGEVAVAAPPNLFVRADPEHLSRMVWNYLQNARVYGAPPVAVEARDAGEHVEIRVQDSGPGVPTEFKDRMFQKFSRADKRLSRQAAGTGLGLAIVRGLAQASGGDAWYEDRGRGACFVVSLPKETRLPEAV